MYVVSTLNKDGSISKKMLSSFSYKPYGNVFENKKQAFKKRDEELNSEYCWISSGRWVVINMKTNRVVTR